MKMQCIESIQKTLNLGDLHFEERAKLTSVRVWGRSLIERSHYHHAA
jgi:hypothetical protein